MEQKEEGIFAKFHLNPNLNKNDDEINTPILTGILRLILIKYISLFIEDINAINSKDIRDIISELKIGTKIENNPEEDIRSNLNQNSGKNIIAYSNYVCSIIKDENDINNLLDLLEDNKKFEIIKYWSLLSKYEQFNQLFKTELLKAIEESYFEYSLIGLSMSEQTNRNEYLKEKYNCPNKEIKYLFHGTQIDPISKIITTGFLYSRKNFFGVGITFSDMLDYTLFYSGGTDFMNRRTNFGQNIPVNEIFSCVSSEVYYCKYKKRNIYDYSLYVNEFDHSPSYEELKKYCKDKMVEKYGVHFTKVETANGRVGKYEEIIENKKKGKFLGNEYIITELCQILPLYGLTFKRNEYFILWRDSHFGEQNDNSDYLKEQKLFINKYANMNSYFVRSLEKALEILSRKQYNKIILISNIGSDLSGKRFVEVARKILGFDVIVLFYTTDKIHFSWVQNFSNALISYQDEYYKDYILNYNEKGLLELKEKVEKQYNLKLKFNNNFLKFPKFINQGKMDDIIFREQSPYFKKVVIKNIKYNSILCMDTKRIISLRSAVNLDINLYEWYITLIGNEITLFSNGNYLGVNIEQKKVIGDECMHIFIIEQLNNNEYLIYYKDKNNVITINEDKLEIKKEKSKMLEQIFKIITIE